MDHFAKHIRGCLRRQALISLFRAEEEGRGRRAQQGRFASLGGAYAASYPVFFYCVMLGWFGLYNFFENAWSHPLTDVFFNADHDEPIEVYIFKKMQPLPRFVLKK